MTAPLELGPITVSKDEGVPYYFFETNDGDKYCRHSQPAADDAAARLLALDALPDMARQKIPDGDSRVFCVDVRNHQEDLIYTATLTLKGGWQPRGDDARADR